MGRGPWQATVDEVTKSWTQLNNFTFDNILCVLSDVYNYVYFMCCAYSLSHVRLFATLYTVAHHTPLSIGILQARILEWVAMSSSRGSS